MKRFHFSLEKVLKLRKYREEETKMELGRAVGVLGEIENRLRQTALERHDAASARFSAENGTFEIVGWDNYIRRLDRETDELLEKAARAEQIVEEKRQLYFEASRDRKALDKLKEKREKEYRRETAREETKVLDEIPGGAPAREVING